MNATGRNVAAVLGGTAVLAAGVYGVTVKVGNGNAEAADVKQSAPTNGAGYGPGPERVRGVGAPDLSKLAGKLGVSEARLRTALATIRDDQRTGHGPQEHLVAPLAKELGVTEAKLRAAFETARKTRPNDHGGRRDPADRGAPPKADADPLAAALAKALGLDDAKVKQALATVGAAQRKEHEARHDTLVAKLAKELGISEAKVRAALPDGLRGGFGRHHFGRGGHGGRRFGRDKMPPGAGPPGPPPPAPYGPPPPAP